MKKISVLLALVAVCVLSGCKGKENAAADQTKAVEQSVQTAPDAMKTSFAELDSALASGDFAKAKTAFDALMRMQSTMTAEQSMAFEQRRADLMAKAAAAAQKGDATAASIVQGVRATRGR